MQHGSSMCQTGATSTLAVLCAMILASPLGRASPPAVEAEQNSPEQKSSEEKSPIQQTPLLTNPTQKSSVIQNEPERVQRLTLVEEFTASTLGKGEVKLGTDVEFGLTPTFMMGTDVTALVVGVASLQAKWLVFDSERHQLSLGVKFAALDRDRLLWGSAREHFRELSARMVRPSLIWTHRLSPRLKLHTFWAKALGKIELKLSEKGRRKLWETKHPGSDYESRDSKTKEPRPKAPEDSTPTAEESPGGEDILKEGENQEKTASETSVMTARSLQVQSVTGIAQERFQLTGEFSRVGGNKILVSTRIERADINDLTSHSFRITASHHWIWPTFQSRLGMGLQYYVITGRDLDGELIDTAGAQPSSDISFYWRI